MNYLCPKCKRTVPVSSREYLCSCGGLWKLDYTPPRFSLDLIEKDSWNLFRYRNFLPLDGRAVSLGEGMTPIIEFGDGLLLKMDYYMPTLSFKDRGAALLVAHCASIGVDSVVQDSSGNAGNSVAAYCGNAGIGCEIFVPEGASPGKIAMIEAHGAKVHIIEGSRDRCAQACRELVEREGRYYASHVYNPFFYEGTKTYLYEVYEQLGRIPRNLFVPLGNGTLFIGLIKAIRELRDSGVITQTPRVFAVQSERCDPLVQAAGRGEARPARIQPAPTLAEGIAIGEPARGEEILEYVFACGVTMLSAREDHILPARERLARRGIYCETTSAAVYAAYLAYCDEHGNPGDCLLPVCGAGLKSDH